MPPVTLKQIALALGVSSMTVSRALRGVGNTAPALTERIREEAERLGYRANPLAKSLRGSQHTVRRSGLNLGLVSLGVPTAETNFSSMLSVAEKRGHRLIFYSTARFKSVAALERAWHAQGVDGLFIHSHGVRDDPVGDILRTRFQWARHTAIKLGAGVPELAFNRVRSSAFQQLTTTYEKVLAAGYRRVLFIIHKSTSPIDDQMRHGVALVSAAEAPARGVHVDSWMIGPMKLDWENFLAPAMTRELHARIETFSPDVIIGFGPIIYAWLRHCGYEIPRHVAYATPCYRLHDAIELAGTCDDIAEVEFSLALQMMEAQLAMGQRGLPELVQEYLVPVRWRDGATLPPRAAS